MFAYILESVKDIQNERARIAEQLGIEWCLIKKQDFFTINGNLDTEYAIVDGMKLYELGYNVNPLMKVIVFKRDEFDEIAKLAASV